MIRNTQSHQPQLSKNESDDADQIPSEEEEEKGSELPSTVMHESRQILNQSMRSKHSVYREEEPPVIIKKA